MRQITHLDAPDFHKPFLNKFLGNILTGILGNTPFVQIIELQVIGQDTA